MHFSNLDYVVLALYLLGTALLGIWLGRNNRGVDDYFLAGRQLPWWALCFSIVATETSTLTFIGAPAFAYDRDLTFLQLAMGFVLGKILVSIFLIPPYFKGEIRSAYEILNRRFGSKVKNFSAALFQVNRTLADGVRLFATALVLSVVTQLSDVWTILIIGLITIVYTFYGGISAVVWNDVIQLGVYLLGAIIALITLLDRIPGGWHSLADVASYTDKWRIFDFSFRLDNPYSFAAALAGGAFLTFATHGTDQMMVQRYLACSEKKKAQGALILSAFIVLVQFALFLLIGILLFVFYQTALRADLPADSQRIFALFIVEEIPRGLSGLVIAAVFAAAMSTLSSSLNSLAASSMNDFYRPYLSAGKGEARELRMSRFLTAGWGILLIGVSLMARNWGSVLEAGLSITSIVMGSILGGFLLGQWTHVKEDMAGLVAMMSGLAVVLLFHFNRVWAWGILPAVAWTWYVAIGTGSTLLAGLFSQWLLTRLSPRR